MTEKRKKKSRFADATEAEIADANVDLIKPKSDDEDDSEEGMNVSSTESEDSDEEKRKLIRKTIDKEAKRLEHDKVKHIKSYGDEDAGKFSNRDPKFANLSKEERRKLREQDRRNKQRQKRELEKKKKKEKSRRSSDSSSGSDSKSSSSSSSSDDSRHRKRKRRKRNHSSSSSSRSRSKGRRRRRHSSSSSSSSSSSGSSSSGSSSGSSRSRSRDKSKYDRKDGKEEGKVVMSIEQLERETRKIAMKNKSLEAKKNYNRFYIRTAPVEIDLMSNETMEERDARTVFIMQIHYKVHARDLHEFFSAVGDVIEVKIMTDDYGKKTKCMGYVEFAEVESVPLAFGLSGQKILGVPIVVKPADADRNRTTNTTAWTRNDSMLKSAKLHVGNLHPNIEEKMLRSIFEPFGKIKHVRLERNQEDGSSKGFGTVEFKSFEPSRRAIDAMNNYNVGGYSMKVQLSAVGLDKEKEDLELIDISGTTTSGTMYRPRKIGVGAHAEKQGWSEWVQGGVKKEEVKDEDKMFIDKRGQLIKKTVSARFDVLDKDEVDRGGVLGMSRTEKVALMARLMDGTGMKLPKGAQEVLDNAQRIREMEKTKLDKGNETEDKNTPCFMLKHMFGMEDEEIVNAENEQDWVDDLEADLIEETLDYGGLVHIHIDRKSDEGIAYLKAPTVYAAKEIIKSLHGRYFGGRVLEAAHIPLTNYNELFPDSIGKDELLVV